MIATVLKKEELYKPHTIAYTHAQNDANPLVPAKTKETQLEELPFCKKLVDLGCYRKDPNLLEITDPITSQSTQQC